MGCGEEDPWQKQQLNSYQDNEGGKGTLGLILWVEFVENQNWEGKSLGEGKEWGSYLRGGMYWQKSIWESSAMRPAKIPTHKN